MSNRNLLSSSLGQRSEVKAGAELVLRQSCVGHLSDASLLVSGHFLAVAAGLQQLPLCMCLCPNLAFSKGRQSC